MIFDNISELETEIVDLRRKLLRCKSCNASESEPCAYPTENAKRLQATVDELRNIIDKLGVDLDEKDAKINALNNRVSELLDERVDLCDELDTRKKEAHEFHSSREYYLNRYRTVRDRLRDANFENTKLRRELGEGF